MCAIEAGKRGRRVVVLEHANQAGKKLLVSGGGRCNFTNWNATPDSYLSQNKAFCVSALTRYTPQDFVALVEKHNIRYEEKKLGQLFCRGPAREVLDMLLTECGAARVTVRVQCNVARVRRAGAFLVDTTMGPVAASSLVIATGGLAMPQMGATGFAYAVARQFGLKVTPLRPGLVPLILSGEALDISRRLAGVSIPCTASCDGANFTESLLFTHRGISGPAILQVSSHWREGGQVYLDLLPGLDLLAHLKTQQVARPRAELGTILSGVLPKRFVDCVCGTLLPNRPMAQLSLKDLSAVVNLLKRWTLSPAGTEGYRTADVTLGGVDTAGLSSKTLSAREVPGLFFVGEALDVTGPLGGYNLHWAWASGYCAGQYA